MSCTCKYSLSNTGTPFCVPIQGVTQKLIIVPLQADDGTYNYIDLSTTLNQAYFTAKLNHADKSKRWYPTPELKNVTSEKADNIFEEFEDGTKEFIQEGVRSFLALMPKKSPQLLGQLKNWRCAKFGVYIVDNGRNIIGAEKEPGKLYPITIESPSWNPILLFGTDTSVQKIQLGFNYDVNELDEQLRMIEYAEITPVNPLGFEGLMDATMTITNISLTGFDVTVETIYGSALNKDKVEGLLAADFSLYNDSSAAAIVITSATEISEGKYSISHAAQTSLDDATLSATKTGYEFTDTSFQYP